MSPAVLRLRVPADASALAGHMQRARRFLREHNIDRRLAYDIPFCVHECCVSAILHGGSPDRIDLRLTLDEESVTILCTDKGGGPDLEGDEPLRRPELLSSCGRGLYLMAQPVDEFEISSGGGTEVRMRKRIADRAA
jgi:anti-sigma regulatory factor (Ser/Thr protein kinase)